ncbi:MAG: hypothetical protein ACYC0Y_14320, partial [Pirellulales bacterium]
MGNGENGKKATGHNGWIEPNFFGLEKPRGKVESRTEYGLLFSNFGRRKNANQRRGARTSVAKNSIPGFPG